MEEIKAIDFDDMLMEYDFDYDNQQVNFENIKNEPLYFDYDNQQVNFENIKNEPLDFFNFDNTENNQLGIDSVTTTKNFDSQCDSYALNTEMLEKTIEELVRVDNATVNENNVTSSQQFNLLNTCTNTCIVLDTIFSSEVHNFTNTFSNQQISFVNLNDLKESFNHETVRKNDMYVICIHLKNSILRCNVTSNECIPENKKNSFLRLEFSDFEKHLLSLEEQFGNIFQNLPVMLIYFAQKRQKNLYHQMYINKFEKTENALKKFKSVLGDNYNPLKKELEGILNPAKKRIRRIKKKSSE